MRAEDWTSGKKRLDRTGKAECCTTNKESRLIPKTVVVENVEIDVWRPAGDEMTSASRGAKGGGSEDDKRRTAGDSGCGRQTNLKLLPRPYVRLNHR